MDNTCTPCEDEKCWYLPFVNEAIDLAIKEVFDDIYKKMGFLTCKVIGNQSILTKNKFNEIKKRHLSTFPKKEKRHNTRLKKERVLDNK